MEGTATLAFVEHGGGRWRWQSRLRQEERHRRVVRTLRGGSLHRRLQGLAITNAHSKVVSPWQVELFLQVDCRWCRCDLYSICILVNLVLVLGSVVDQCSHAACQGAVVRTGTAEGPSRAHIDAS